MLHGEVVFHSFDGGRCDVGDPQVFGHGDWGATRLERGNLTVRGKVAMVRQV